MRDRVLLDTGPLVALLSRADQNHVACAAYARGADVTLVTCWPVLTEGAWLLQSKPGGIARMLASVDHPDGFDVLPLTKEDTPKISELLHRYRNINLQLADAALVHLANREHIETVFTLDRRDFTIVRGAHGKRFSLVP